MFKSEYNRGSQCYGSEERRVMLLIIDFMTYMVVMVVVIHIVNNSKTNSLLYRYMIHIMKLYCS